MTEQDAINIIISYLIFHGFLPKRIKIKSLSQGKKSPDLEIFENNKMSFLCEIKSPLLLINEDTKMFHWTTTMSKGRTFIHKAVKQFKDYDPNHQYPWVINFTSDNFQLNWTNMIHILHGVVFYDKTIIKDLREVRYVIDTKEDVKNIDMFIWNQINKNNNRLYQIKIVLNKNLPHIKKSKSIAEKFKSRKEENIDFLRIDEIDFK